MDRVVNGEVYQFMANSVGKLGTTPTKATVVDIETQFNTLKVPFPRYCVLTPSTKGALSNVSEFTDAEKIGDDGSAMRTGSLGLLSGTSFIMSQNVPSVGTGNTTSTTAITTDGAAAGATSIPVTAFTTEHDTHLGGWLTVAGDMTPQKIIGIDAANDELDIYPGLKTAVVDTAVVTIYVPGKIDLTAGYANGYVDEIAVDTFTVAPKIGQLLSIDAAAAASGTTANYSVLESINGPSTTVVLPNRPLDAAAVNNGIVGIGPAGQFNFAFHPQALALVSRPLAAPRSNLADSFVANYNGLSVRVVITYDGKAQGHRVTVDALCGVKVLNANMGMVFYA
jgi:hypothetical protein